MADYQLEGPKPARMYEVILPKKIGYFGKVQEVLEDLFNESAIRSIPFVRRSIERFRRSDPSFDDDGWVRTCAIVTTRANARLMPLHDRMPALLPEGAWSAWLDPRPAGHAARPALRRLLAPAPDDWVEAYAVSTRVNQADDHDADLIRPVEGSRVP